MKSFHSHLGFPELQTPAFGGKQILHQKTSQAVDFNGTKISEILDQNRTCARSIQTPKGTPNRLHLCRYRSSKTEIIKMGPILGGSNLMQMYGTFYGFPLNTALFGLGIS